MAPSHGCLGQRAELRLPAEEKHKLRKPAVEKLRRDRINGSIEQLKGLLEREFRRHQPNSKLEKADVLEVAVGYLRQQRQAEGYGFGPPRDPEVDFNAGYLDCLREAVGFLAACDPRREAQALLVRHFCRAHALADATRTAPTATARPPASPCAVAKKPPASKPPPGASGNLWRPW